MNKMKIRTFMFILATLLAIFSANINAKATNYKVVDSFPQTINNITIKGDKVNYNNYHGQYFQQWSNEAVYCTDFRLTRPSENTNVTCKLVSNPWGDEALQTGVASIIMAADASNSGITKNYYYADLAINYFLFQHDLNSDGTKKYDHQITSYNATQSELKSVFGDYTKYLDAADEAFTRYNNKPDVRLVGSTTNKTKWQVNAENKDSISNTYQVDGSNMDSAKVTVYLYGASSDVKVYINNQETNTVSGLKNGDSFTVKVGNLSDGENFSVNVSITAQMDYYIAAKYDCILNNITYQGITLNRVMKKTMMRNYSTTFRVSTYDAPDYPDLKIVKTDESGNKIAGAGINLYSKENNSTTNIKTFNNSNQSEYTYEDLDPGEYCVAEFKAPSKYLLDDTEHCFIVTKDNTTNAISITKSKEDDASIEINDNLVTVTLVNKENLLRISKVNEQGNFLKGAKLKLTTQRDINAEAYLEWESTDGYKEITGIPVGTYYLYEVEVPDGFIKTDDYRIITITQYTKSSIRVAFTNKPNSISISKIDIANGEELPGASLRILKDDGVTVATDIFGNKLEWVSTNEPHTISKIPTGTYYLEETQAPKSPKSYSLMTEKIKFTIDEYGKVTVNEETSDDSVIIMSNALTRVSISKQDITTKEELPGAHLILKNEDNVNVEEWDSTNEPYLIEGLAPGTYTLTEVTAPDGYQLNEESIIFTINEDGSVTGDTVMYNTPIPEVPSTSANYSVLIIIGGVMLVCVGIGLYIYGIKKQKSI